MYVTPKIVAPSTVDVLSFLVGRPYDQISENFMAALRPSELLVIEHGCEVPTNFVPWRVKVLLDSNGTIKAITQETQVGTVGYAGITDILDVLSREKVVPTKPAPVKPQTTADKIVSLVNNSKSRGQAYDLLDASINACPIDGMLLEFGVASGATINHIAKRTTRTVYGFDSFNGLPEYWTKDAPRGTFSTHGAPPKVKNNVQLVIGWFDQTVKKFVDEKREPIAFVHIDCDLYSSTKTVLQAIEPYLMDGAVINFNELLGYPQAGDHELKAFAEFLDGGWEIVECIGRSGKAFSQAAFIVRRTKECQSALQSSSLPTTGSPCLDEPCGQSPTDLHQSHLKSLS